MAPKIKQTVSAAGVFKKKTKAANGKKKGRRKEATEKPDLLVEFRGIFVSAWDYLTRC
jgi:hypothetical protein